MKPTDRARLTAPSASTSPRSPPICERRCALRATRDRAQQLHADEQVAEDFEVWTDLLSRRAAVLWVLKSVYVRVLEDRGLLEAGTTARPGGAAALRAPRAEPGRDGVPALGVPRSREPARRRARALQPAAGRGGASLPTSSRARSSRSGGTAMRTPARAGASPRSTSRAS